MYIYIYTYIYIIYIYTPRVQRRNFATPFQQKIYFAPLILGTCVTGVSRPPVPCVYVLLVWGNVFNLFDLCIWHTWGVMKGIQNHYGRALTCSLVVCFKFHPNLSLFWGGHASRRSLAVPRQSLVIPRQSLAVPRLRHGRVTTPYCSHWCCSSFYFMSTFQLQYIPFIGVGWGSHSWSCNFLRIFISVTRQIHFFWLKLSRTDPQISGLNLKQGNRGQSIGGHGKERSPPKG